MPGRVSQRDIAERLNISVATVSRSLRNDRAIHPQTRARVLEVAARLGYRLPDGRSPTRPAVRTVQVFLSQEPQPGIAAEQILAGISEAAEIEQFQVSIHMVEPAAVGELIQDNGRPVGMRAGLVDGALLMMDMPAEIVRAISMNVPCVSVVHRFAELGIDGIDCNPMLAVFEMVDRLVGAGHRRIGFLGWGGGAHWELLSFQGFRESLFQHGIAHDEALVVGGDRSLPAGQAFVDALEDLLARGVTAMVCTADEIAADARAVLTGSSTAGARDVALAAYGGGPVGRSCPGLLLAAVPYRDLGVAAIRRLTRRMVDRSEQPRMVLLRPSFETVGPPGSAHV